MRSEQIEDKESNRDLAIEEKARKSKRKPFSASRFALKPKTSNDSVVGRLAAASAARRKKKGKRVADSSSSNSDSSTDSERENATALGSSQPGRFLRNLRIDSDSESDAESDSKVNRDDSPEHKDGSKEAKGKKTSKSNAAKEPKERKERAASKAAIALMHRETERLVRETAVKIEPLEFTKRLELEDFFARFSAFSLSKEEAKSAPTEPVNEIVPKPEPRKIDSNMPTKFHYESDSNDYDVEIVDETHLVDSSSGTAAAAAPDTMVVLSPQKLLSPNKRPGLSNKDSDELDAILKYGSQPLHASARLSNAPGIKRTDGPLALKELNGALLSAVYRKEKEAMEKKSRKKREPQQEAEAEIEVEQDREEEEDREDGGGDDDDDEEEYTEGMDVDGANTSSSSGDSGDDSDGSDDEEALDKQQRSSSSRKKHRVAVISDEEDEASERDSGNLGNPNGQASARKTPSLSSAADRPISATPEPAVSRSKFIGMFKMPTRPKPKQKTEEEVCVPQPSSPPLPPPRQSSDTPSSQRDHSVDASQDLAYMITSQIDQINTQDSLLMTPSQMSQLENTFGMSMATQAQHMDMGTMDALTQEQLTQPTQPLVEPTQFSMGITQPTQPLQITQPTQSLADDGVPGAGTDFVATAADEDSGLSSVLPTMVRRALNPEKDQSDRAAETNAETSTESDAEAGQPEQGSDQEASRSRRRIGRLIRRSGNDDGGHKDQAIKKAKQKKTRMRRSEFIEAEAEVGESSDSDNEGGLQPGGKFSWGQEQSRTKPDVSSDEEEDLDSDEEAAALLADPMINNEVSEDSSDELAIRELHRQRDFDQDERDIQELARDIATGNLRNRGSRNRREFGLGMEENYIDRQDRAERMEERLRMRRRMEAREIHDTNLAAIAKNPETAAFARAALMRPPPSTSGYQSGSDADDLQLDMNQAGMDDYEDNVFALEEVVDDHHVAAAIEQQLAQGVRRNDSDAESESEMSTRNGRLRQRPSAVGRIAGPVGRSLSGGLSDMGSSIGVGGGDIDGDLFTTVSVEKLIVRRSTLLKRPGAPLASRTDMKRRTSK
ncbi:hypothetical protein FB639_002304 [Coemansia asiatica]|nr:hypothetical protein FB639_002304 [Coemansia asiatica]